MTKTAKVWIIVAVSACVAVACCVGLFGYVGYLLINSDWPGGMRPSYPAADFDVRLTQYAASAKPLIAALDRFHGTNGRFPAQLKDLSSILPSTGTQSPGTLPNQFQEWYYQPSNDGAAYEIDRKLGWDPVLSFRVDGGRRQWIFVRGDGSGEVPIQLKP